MQENTAETQIITENIESDEGFKKFQEKIIKGLKEAEDDITNGRYTNADIVFARLKEKYRV